jgi:WD40 repeat protein
MRYLLSISCFLAACTVQAQFVSLGMKGGIPVTPALPNLSYSDLYQDTGRWTVGPTIELHLVSSLSFEADALFRGYTVVTNFVSFSPSNTPLLDSSKASVKAWDFPLLLKYRITSRAIRPFVDGGYLFTHESTDVFTSSICAAATLPCVPPNPPDYNGEFKSSLNLNGPAAGAGVEFRYGRIKIAPEVRYSHLNPNINLATVLVGVTF